MKAPKCPLCKERTELVTGLDLYPNREDLAKKYFYICRKDDTRVGCHPETKNPLGTPASASLRKLRSTVHRLLDPLWQNDHMTRSECYRWLAKSMNIRPSKTHVGMFSQGQCSLAIDILEQRWKEIKREEHKQNIANKWKPKESLFGD